MDRDKDEILKLKKEKVFEAQIQFYSQGILIVKDYYSSCACIVSFFFWGSFSSIFILILTFISFSSLLFLYLLFSFSFSFLWFSLFFLFPCPLLGKGAFFHLKIILTFLYHSSTKLAPSIELILSNIRLYP